MSKKWRLFPSPGEVAYFNPLALYIMLHKITENNFEFKISRFSHLVFDFRTAIKISSGMLEERDGIEIPQLLCPAQLSRLILPEARCRIFSIAIDIK